jgi:hypothetical protein
VNLDLPETFRFARELGARVYEWGPYRIRPELYERGLRQIERLNSGRIAYKVLDGAWRPDGASNCIHAVPVPKQVRCISLILLLRGTLTGHWPGWFPTLR